jgi:hypothetical protein
MRPLARDARKIALLRRGERARSVRQRHSVELLRSEFVRLQRFIVEGSAA